MMSSSSMPWSTSPRPATSTSETIRPTGSGQASRTTVTSLTSSCAPRRSSEAELADMEPSTAAPPCVMVGPARDWAARFGLPGLVRASAERAPGAVALKDERGSLTYAALEARSDARAARLRSSGGRPGDVVAVCLPRGQDMVVALLAALKAHMPYLPLSAADPQRHRDLLLSLSGARHALADADTERLLGQHQELKVCRGESGAAAGGSWSELTPYGGGGAGLAVVPF